MRPGSTPAARASASSPGLATSAPMPSSRSSRSTGTSGLAFTANACSTGVPGAVTASKASRRSAADSRMPVTSSSPTRGASVSRNPCSTAARTAASRRAARPAARGSAPAVTSPALSLICSFARMHPAKHPPDGGADAPPVLTSSIHPVRM